MCIGWSEEGAVAPRRWSYRQCSWWSEEGLVALEVESQAVVSNLTGMLGTELCSSERAASNINT